MMFDLDSFRSQFDPPAWLVRRAVQEARRSPCAKSKRGVVIWRPAPDSGDLDGHVEALGFNAQPPGFVCDGSSACKAACAKICEHAEAAALRDLGPRCQDQRLELLHVKVVVPTGGHPRCAARLADSGPPSCWQCSKAILLDGRVAGVWLFHESGWRRYTPADFHRLTLEHCGLPVLEAPCSR